jgi:hypothetical protein
MDGLLTISCIGSIEEFAKELIVQARCCVVSIFFDKQKFKTVYFQYLHIQNGLF